MSARSNVIQVASSHLAKMGVKAIGPVKVRRRLFGGYVVMTNADRIGGNWELIISRDCKIIHVRYIDR